MLPTEPIGSVPRPVELIDAMQRVAPGTDGGAELRDAFDAALRDTISRFEATGSPVITDGEQTKSSFVTYSLDGLDNLEADGAVIPFADGHVRQLPRLSSGPFRYGQYADSFTTSALEYATVPVKQAVIAVSALSLLYPEGGLAGYDREQFLADLVAEGVTDIRRCLDAGADKVQIDFTEGRLSLKLDPSGGLLRDFVALNNAVLDHFDNDERARIGVHTCPGGDQDSTHSLDVNYSQLLPELFGLHAGNFYLQMASEPDPASVLAVVAEHLPEGTTAFVGVIDPIDPRVETPEQVRDRILLAARHIPLPQLGSCDDCGFSPFGDDISTSRDTAFDKIRARVEGTALASAELGI